jgi:hypothetical protein
MPLYYAHRPTHNDSFWYLMYILLRCRLEVMRYLFKNAKNLKSRPAMFRILYIYTDTQFNNFSRRRTIGELTSLFSATEIFVPVQTGASLAVYYLTRIAVTNCDNNKTNPGPESAAGNRPSSLPPLPRPILAPHFPMRDMQ